MQDPTIEMSRDEILMGIHPTVTTDHQEPVVQNQGSAFNIIHSKNAYDERLRMVKKRAYDKANAKRYSVASKCRGREVTNSEEFVLNYLNGVMQSNR